MGFWRSAWRIVVVGFAVLMAMAAAGFVLVTLGLEKVTQAMHGREVVVSDIDGAFGTLLIAARLFSATTLLPALALVVIGEVARIRSSLYYIVGGGAALAVIPLIARLGEAGAGVPALAVWQVFATAGFAGGLVYWVTAGRGA